jgi:hypothetical protein
MSSAIIIGSVVAAGASVYSGSQAKKGAAQAASAEAAAREELMNRLTGAATDASATVNAIAGEYKAEVDQAISGYRKSSFKLADAFTYTPVRGILEKDENGRTKFDELFDLYARSDEARRKRVLGDSEPLIREALEEFSRMSSGDFSGFQADLRSSEASIAASTRGGPIGVFANLAAQNRLRFMREGSDTAMSIAGLLSSFDTETPVVFQSALQVTDESRREAERKDTTERLKIATKLDIEKATLGARVDAAVNFANMSIGAANTLATALAGGAQAGFTGSGGAGIAAALRGQTAAGVASAVNSGVSNYLQYKQSQETIAAIRSSGASRTAASDAAAASASRTASQAATKASGFY